MGMEGLIKAVASPDTIMAGVKGFFTPPGGPAGAAVGVGMNLAKKAATDPEFQGHLMGAAKDAFGSQGSSAQESVIGFLKQGVEKMTQGLSSTASEAQVSAGVDKGLGMGMQMLQGMVPNPGAIMKKTLGALTSDPTQMLPAAGSGMGKGMPEIPGISEMAEKLTTGLSSLSKMMKMGPGH